MAACCRWAPRSRWSTPSSTYRLLEPASLPPSKEQMNFAKTSLALAIASLTALAAPPALAQDAGWYAGGNVGRAATTIDDARITQGLAGQGLGTASIDNQDR